MSRFSAVRSVGGWIASATGYPAVVQRAINAFPMRDHLDIADRSSIERGVRLAENISLESDVRICARSTLRGDVNLSEGVCIGRNSTLNGRISVGPRTRLAEELEVFGTVNISDNVVVGPDSKLSGQIEIGSGSNFIENLEIVGEDIEIGKYNAVARDVSLLNRNHLTSNAGIQVRFYEETFGDPLEMPAKGPLSVGNDVWIGMRSLVLSGVTIGNGAVVGAGSVVTNDVEPYAIVAGTPAERIGWRFDHETRKELLDISWWDWPAEKISQNERFFTTNLEKTDELETLIE